MDFRDLLRLHGFDPDGRERIILLRHRPFEPALARNMPWIIHDRPDLFEAYQSVPGASAARSLRRAALVASFLGMAPGTAHFVGLYRIRGHHEITFDHFWNTPENRTLADLGYEGMRDPQGRETQFDLELLPFYPEWRGRLVIGFPPPERSWVRRVERGRFPVRAIREESAFHLDPPDWRDIDLGLAELQNLPLSWKARLAEWRGIYLIFDESDRRCYVGSAAGHDNILGRWLSYARGGHGGNVELKGRNPELFRFTILERVSPDLPVDEVVAREASWKRRLHTRRPHGLNAN